MQKMYYLLMIGNRQDQEEQQAVFEKHGVPWVYSLPCHGTARPGNLEVWGLENTEKVAHFAPVTQNLADALLDSFTRELKIDLPQKGIAITVPMTSISGATALTIFAGGHENDEMNREPNMQTEKELIVIICERGHTEEVMTAARSAGAGGGTILHARGTGTEIAQKFYGISLAAEKEMILIVTRSDQKKDIMRAISKQAGVTTPARAVSFSLPVTETAGLRFFEETDREA